jgi:exopolysaccharide biosynthesis predicted pyruvyltransferase EpsI
MTTILGCIIIASLALKMHVMVLINSMESDMGYYNTWLVR